MQRKQPDPCQPMSCAVCDRCCASPNDPSRCIFGGPFEGYQPQEKEND